MVGPELALQPLNHAVCSGGGTWSKVPKVCIGVRQSPWALAYKANRRLWPAVGDAPTSQPPVGWNGRTDVGWVVRIVSLILIFHEAPIPSVDGSGLRKEKGISYVQPCSLLPLRASETNSSTIHSVINIGRDPNQFLSRTAINLGPQRWLPHIPISCPGRVQMRASLLCLC